MIAIETETFSQARIDLPLPDRVTPKEIIPLGLAWAGSSVNCVPFRVSGVLTRHGVCYCAYYDPSGNVVVARVACGGHAVSRHILANPRPPFDAHRAISLGLDCEKRIHLAFGAHDSTLLVARANGPEFDSGFSAAVALDDELALRITYPMFLSFPGGDQLILLFRNGSAADAEWRIKRFDTAAGRWQDDPRPIITGRQPPLSPSGPYVNTPAYGPDGEIVLFIVWRLRSHSNPDAVNNAGIDCVVSNDGLRTLTTADREPLSIPISQADRTRIVAIPPNASLMNQGTAAIRKDGSAMFLTYWDDGDGVPQYRLGWQDGRAWRVSTASRFRTPFKLHGPGTLALPHSRPEIVLGGDGRAYVIFRSREYGGRLALLSLEPPRYELTNARYHLLVDEDLGFYEPVVDRHAWAQDRTLLIYVQRCDQQFDGDRRAYFSAAEARLMIWREEQFA
jgi:hypothetical protein